MIKDYIGKEIDEKIAPSKEKTITDFSIEECSGCDIVINKKTKTTDVSLVLIVSQKLYYLKDNKKNVNIALDEDSFSRFARAMKHIDTPDLTWASELDFIPDRRHLPASDLWKTLHTDAFIDMAKMGLGKYCFVANDNYSYYSRPSKYAFVEDNEYSKHKKLLKFISEDNPTCPINIINLSCMVDSYYGLDIARQWYEESLKTSMEIGCDNMENLQITRLFKICDQKTLRQYLFYDIYRQGYNALDVSNRGYYGHGETPISTLLDYCDMQTAYYGKIKDKYPEHLREAHDILARNYNLKKAMLDNVRLENIATEAEKSGMTGEYKGFVFSIPHTAEDLIDEGTQLSHCVGGYGPRIIEGSCRIFFMRLTSSPEHSYITIEVLPNNNIAQIQANYKRTSLSDEEKNAIRAWAKASNIKKLSSNHNFDENDDKKLEREKKTA